MSIPEKPHSKGDTFTNPETGVEYTYDGVKWLASGGDELDLDLSNYVKKTGGDSMEGPLDIHNHPGGNSREIRRVHTLGVFSNSEQSALRLGTTRDRVYVGHNDVSINGPVKLQSIESKDSDKIYIKDDAHFNNRIDVDNGIKINITDPNAINPDHDDYDLYSKFLSLIHI